MQAVDGPNAGFLFEGMGTGACFGCLRLWVPVCCALLARVRFMCCLVFQ
jgi:hypothetical protein